MVVERVQGLGGKADAPSRLVDSHTEIVTV
jgi:hypothetical protein